MLPVTWTLFAEISWSAFVGIGILVAFFILSSVILRVVCRVHAAQMTEKDKRLRLIRELLSGIRVVNINARELASSRASVLANSPSSASDGCLKPRLLVSRPCFVSS